MSKIDLVEEDYNVPNIISNQIPLNGIGESLTPNQKFFILKRLGFDGLLSLDDIPPTAHYIIEKVESLSIDKSLEILTEALLDHDGDVNIPTKDYDLWDTLINEKNNNPVYLHHSGEDSEKKSQESKIEFSVDQKTTVVSSEDEVASSFNDTLLLLDWPLQVRLEAAIIEFYSPYPEVRAVTEPFDDPTIACETIRVYILGVIWTAIGAVVDQFFSGRQPAITLSSSVVQIFLFPCGTFLAYILPKWKFKIWNVQFDLNPGPWTNKEQMLATLFYSVTGGHASYVSSNIQVQKLKQFYNNEWADFGYQTLLMLSNNFLGFGLAGIIRKFAVYPHQSVWPSVLPGLAVNRVLMKKEVKENIHGWKISSFKFFFVAFVGSFLYFWIPNYLFRALSTFSWISWISPNNLDLVNVVGFRSGLGLNPIPSFDWNIINYNNPLVLPFYNQMNNLVGLILGFCTILGLWYSNTSWTKFIPINTNALYNNKGTRYQVSQVVNKNSLFDQQKYDSYGPPYYSAASLVAYGSFFLSYPFLFFYESVIYWRPITKAFKKLWQSMKNYRLSTYDGFTDPFSRHMRVYKEVPEWAFLLILIISISLLIVCVQIYPAQTPVWSIFFAVGINFLFLIPITAIHSRTGFGFSLNVLTQLVIGYAIPGNGLALNFVKAIGLNTGLEAENYISNQKQAHYLKIPPRALFRTQILSVFITTFVELGILTFKLNGGIKNYCEPLNTQKFTCPGITQFYNASIAWGVIGPKKMFNGIYPVLPWTFVIGFVLVFPCVAFKWYAPKKYTKYFQPSVIMGGLRGWAPYNLSYHIAGLYTSYVFMLYIKKRYQSWWSKYTYVLGAGLSAGVAFSAIIIFFTVEYHPKPISWWGNNIISKGYEGRLTAGLNATHDAPDGYFGLRKGDYP